MVRQEKGITRFPEVPVNKDRLVENFLTLVQLDSPTGEEPRVANYLLDWFKSREITAKQDKAGNVFAKVPGTGEPLFLSAHMDTVEPGRGIEPKVRGGTIRSSGKTILGADNKSTITVLLETVDLLKKGKHRPLEVLFTVDEESNNSGALGFDYSKLKAKQGLIADIAEPIGTIVLASPAYFRFDANLSGKSAHAAYPDQGVDVLDSLSNVLKIKKGQLDSVTTLNIGLVQAGTARNTIPGEATVSGEVRSYDETQLAKNLGLTLERIERAVKESGVRLSLTYKKDNPGYVFDEADPFIKALAETIKRIGINPHFIWNPSCSDANIFNANGLQVVNIGDGTQNTHTRNELIKISDMVKLVNIFFNFVRLGIDNR